VGACPFLDLTPVIGPSRRANRTSSSRCDRTRSSADRRSRSGTAEPSRLGVEQRADAGRRGARSPDLRPAGGGPCRGRCPCSRRFSLALCKPCASSRLSVSPASAQLAHWRNALRSTCSNAPSPSSGHTIAARIRKLPRALTTQRSSSLRETHTHAQSTTSTGRPRRRGSVARCSE
jgi:hypothetical protein